MDNCTKLPIDTGIMFPPLNGWLRVENNLASPFCYICNIVPVFRSNGTPDDPKSGVLIASNLVMTAAHTLWPYPEFAAKEVFIRVPNKKNKSEPFFSTRTARIIFWPQYNLPNCTLDGMIDFTTPDFENDLALIVTEDIIGQENGSGLWGEGLLKMIQDVQQLGLSPAGTQVRPVRVTVVVQSGSHEVVIAGVAFFLPFLLAGNILVLVKRKLVVASSIKKY